MNECFQNDRSDQSVVTVVPLDVEDNSVKNSFMKNGKNDSNTTDEAFQTRKKKSPIDQYLEGKRDDHCNEIVALLALEDAARNELINAGLDDNDRKEKLEDVNAKNREEKLIDYFKKNYPEKMAKSGLRLQLPLKLEKRT